MSCSTFQSYLNESYSPNWTLRLERVKCTISSWIWNCLCERLEKEIEFVNLVYDGLAFLYKIETQPCTQQDTWNRTDISSGFCRYQFRGTLQIRLNLLINYILVSTFEMGSFAWGAICAWLNNDIGLASANMYIYLNICMFVCK